MKSIRKESGIDSWVPASGWPGYGTMNAKNGHLIIVHISVILFCITLMGNNTQEISTDSEQYTELFLVWDCPEVTNKFSPNDILVLNNGDILLCGYLWGRIDIDPGPANIIVGHPGGSTAIVMKFTQDGILKWYNASWQEAGSIALDLSVSQDGRIHVAGYGTNFTGTEEAYSENHPIDIYHYNAFVTELSVDGEINWTELLLDDDVILSSYIAEDTSDNIYVTGFYYGPAEFSQDSLEAETPLIGDSDAFLIKLSRDGNIVWHKAWGHIDSYTKPYGIVIDEEGYPLVIGEIKPASGNSSYSYSPCSRIIEEGESSSGFIRKFQPNGNTEWDITWETDIRGLFDNCIAENNNSLYASMNFSCILEFRSAQNIMEILTNESNVDKMQVFVSKIGGDGNLVWNQIIDVTDNPLEISSIRTITTDNIGNVYLAGLIENKLTGIPDPEIQDETFFMVKLDTTGAIQWIETGNQFTAISGIVVDSNNVIYVCGSRSMNAQIMKFMQ